MFWMISCSIVDKCNFEIITKFVEEIPLIYLCNDDRNEIKAHK